MADKKISELTEATTINASDLLHIVQSGVNKKLQTETFASGLNKLSANGSNTVLVKSILTVNSTHPSGNSVIGQESSVIHNRGNSVHQIFGMKSSITLGSNANTVVTGTTAAIYAVVDASEAPRLGNAYGIMVDMAASGTRYAVPNAFIALGEGSSSANATLHLMEIGTKGKHVAIGANSTSTMFSTRANTAITHSIKIMVDGNTFYIPLCSSNP